MRGADVRTRDGAGSPCPPNLLWHRSLAIQRLTVAIYEAVFDVERPILSKLFQKALALRMLVVPVK
ncbi:MAG: hypothetical protein DME20_09390 [Verrucomicrobia bacterium]|nr:MAG: hypothetical protein DME92_09485 [Verrucomicrobiota bacterium]PYJ63850.1 MAG: hypothetical protein DME74_01820 [Verrucomicrobiota bacterium]PYJ88331.1 MAG: hypothetical protein DME71_13320 [Verrucomicrobiota bacterium]PYK48307.1 MAG: hypothetical protein DME20_09390 [Verrucomicrobiota bacterium]PYL44462.1 MAG: hypothetical protein DMF42_00990 [Verrucomicrobiota bacterium]